VAACAHLGGLDGARRGSLTPPLVGGRRNDYGATFMRGRDYCHCVDGGSTPSDSSDLRWCSGSVSSGHSRQRHTRCLTEKQTTNPKSI